MIFAVLLTAWVLIDLHVIYRNCYMTAANTKAILDVLTENAENKKSLDNQL
jgi:hypothetical protein